MATSPPIRSVQGGTTCLRDRICPTCRTPLPEGRKSHYCRDCLKAYRRRLAENPNRKCIHCGEPMPVGRIDYRCADCQRKDDGLTYRRRRSRDRKCPRCPAIVPAGRTSNYCLDCAREKQKAWTKQRTRCTCGGKARRSYSSYCDYCHRERCYDYRHREKRDGVSGA